MFPRFIAILALAAAMSAPISAAAIELADAAGRYRISPQGSNLTFSVDRVGGGGLRGRFTDFSGDVRIDGHDVSRSRVDFMIVPGSVTAGEGRIDAFLKSDAVFDAANETSISFRSRRIRRTGERTAHIEGALTARGRTAQARFDVELVEFGRRGASFHVTGKVLRSLYGMDVGTPIYSNVVDFEMTLRANRR